MFSVVVLARVGRQGHTAGFAVDLNYLALGPVLVRLQVEQLWVDFRGDSRCVLKCGSSPQW